MADVVVTERCDQTIVEVYTCPPAGGGDGGSGAFYTGENLGTGARVYVETDDTTDPREHRFRTIVGIDGITAEEVGDEVHIGGGGEYTGVNVGGGAGVYKETDNTVNPREHRLRSLVAGDNILIVPSDDEILISTLGTVGSGATPPGFAAGVLNNGCGASVSFNPAAFGGLAQGDFMLWAIVTNFVQNGYPATVPPTGWDILWNACYQANQYRFLSLYYKRVDAIDLLPGTVHTTTRPVGATNTLCATVFVYKNIHIALPFAGAVGAYSLGRNQCPHMPILVNGSPCFASWQSHAAGAFGGTGQYGPAIDHSATHQSGSFGWYLAGWNSRDDEDENWIAGESLLDSGRGAGWTYNNATVTRSGPYDGRMDPINGVARHYIEYSVELAAGTLYTFAFNTKSQWATGENGQITISYEDPAANERLLHLQGTGAEVNAGACTRKDPLADLNTTWFNRTHRINEDGVPSTTGFVACIEFTALTSGTYKLRVGISNETQGEVCGLGSTNRRFSGISFRRGQYPYRRVHTPSGAVYNGTGRKAAHGPSFLAGVAGGVGRIVNGLVLNPAWDVLPKARLHSGCGAAGDLDFCMSDDGLTIHDYRPTTDDFAGWARADRPVMPTVNSVPQKYYMEWTVLNAGTNVDLGFDYPFNSAGLHDDGGAYVGYYWLGTGSFGNPAASVGGPDTGTAGNALGDILGASVNYIDREVCFYKNGTKIKTIALIDGYPANGLAGIQPMMPLWAFGRVSYVGGSDTPGELRANLSGPFAYPVSGFLAYDYAGQSAVIPIDEVGSIGTGYPIMAGTPEAPLIKSLADGDGIKIDDDGATLNVRVAKNEVPSVIPTTAVRGVAWSNPTNIVVVDAMPVMVVCPHDGTLTGYTVMADAAGSAVVDVRKTTFAGIPAGSGDRICGINKPSLSSALKRQDLFLSDWNTTVLAGDILTFVLESCTGIKQLTVQLTIQQVIP